MRKALAATLLAMLGATTACTAQAHYIHGTKVVDNTENRSLIGVIETYRTAMERKDAPALLAMASKNYWEDGGTPTGADDYGYDGLRDVLSTRFERATDIRYSLHYMKVKRVANRAFIDVLIDASYAITTTKGSTRQDMRDVNEMVLEYDGRHWLFLSGM